MPSRRELLRGGVPVGLFGLGAVTPSRFPYPERPQPAGAVPAQGRQVRANTVIVFGPSGAVSGIFVYAPGTTPAAGNPPIIALGNSTADPFGNSVRPGDANPAGSLIVLGPAPPGGTQRYAQLFTGSPPAFILGTGDPLETFPARYDAGISGAGGTRQLVTQVKPPSFGGVTAAVTLASMSQDGTVSASAQLAGGLGIITLTDAGANITKAITAQGGNAANPSVITTDLWQNAALINSFTGTLQYKLMPDQTTRLLGEVTCPVAGFNFTNINTAPAAAYGLYTTPLGGQGAPVLCYNSTAGTTVLAKVFGNGQVQFVNAAASAVIVFNGDYPNS